MYGGLDITAMDVLHMKDGKPAIVLEMNDTACGLMYDHEKGAHPPSLAAGPPLHCCGGIAVCAPALVARALAMCGSPCCMRANR